METMEVNLKYTIPKMCAYFKTEEFHKIMIEFHKYKNNVTFHFDEFEKTKATWTRLLKNAM